MRRRTARGGRLLMSRRRRHLWRSVSGKSKFLVMCCLPMIATRFVSGGALELLIARAQGSSGMTCDSRTILTMQVGLC